MPVLADAQHELFAQRVAQGSSDVEAYKYAGYSEKSAQQNACRLRANEGIRSRIVELLQRQADRAELSAARVLEELRRLAFTDARQFFDEAGNLVPVKDLTAEQGSILSSFEIIKKNAEAGDGLIDTVHKFKVWDKTKALEMLAKYFGLLQERVEHSGEVQFRWMEKEDKQ